MGYVVAIVTRAVALGVGCAVIPGVDCTVAFGARASPARAPSHSNLAAPSVSVSLNGTTAGLGVGCISIGYAPVSQTALAALSSLAAPLASALASAALSPLALRHRLCPCRPDGHIIGCALVGLGMFGACASSCCAPLASALAAPLASALA